jgi:3-hydroxyisobutyrate dehydrogenase-like beta-hydroxyacid dehydrogenase
LVGGEAAAFERSQPILGAMGKRIIHGAEATVLYARFASAGRSHLDFSSIINFLRGNFMK